MKSDLISTTIYAHEKDYEELRLLAAQSGMSTAMLTRLMMRDCIRLGKPNVFRMRDSYAVEMEEERVSRLNRKAQNLIKKQRKLSAIKKENQQ